MVQFRSRSLGRRLKIGVVSGVGIAGVFSAWAVVQYVLQGPELFTRLGVPVGIVVLGYALMGILSGGTVGLAWPLTRWAVGSMAVGFLAAFPAWFVMFFAMSDDPLFEILEIVRGSLVLSLAFGPAVGFAGWYQARRYRGR